MSSATTCTGSESFPAVPPPVPPPYAGRPVPRRWGWRVRGGGRAAHVEPGAAYAGTTSQLCGLFPFAVSSGATVAGVPIGRHMHTAEPVGLDPAVPADVAYPTDSGLLAKAVQRGAAGQGGRGEAAVGVQVGPLIASTASPIPGSSASSPTRPPALCRRCGRVWVRRPDGRRRRADAG